MTLGLFAPLPLPVMIPFMGFQSLVMGEAFGLSYQYAKRKISAMTNDEFNKLTIPEVQRMLKGDIQSAIPTMAASMKDMQTLQTEMIQYAVNALAQLPSDIYNAVIGTATAGRTVEQGEQGLPLGVAGFLRPILTDPVGGLLKQGKNVIPEPYVIPSENVEHDDGMFVSDTPPSGKVQLANYPPAATITQVHASQLERFRAAAKIEQDRIAREESNARIEAAKQKTNATVKAREQQLIDIIKKVGQQIGVLRLNRYRDANANVKNQQQIERLIKNLNVYNAELAALVTRYKR